MIAHGELPPIDAAIFADTQWEPRHVYEWLEWLEKQLPFPVIRVTGGNIREAAINQQNTTGQRFAALPWFITNPDGTHGMGRRQCTKEFKLEPLLKAKRALLGLVPRQRARGVLCQTLIGISTDEASRMKVSRESWNVNSYPLIDVGMSRSDCLAWMERNGYPRPPKSSCVACPFHSDDEWRLIKEDPEAWADVLRVDESIRIPVAGKMRGVQFMHADRIPMRDVDLASAEERGQINLFENECEGMCGL